MVSSGDLSRLDSLSTGRAQAYVFDRSTFQRVSVADLSPGGASFRPPDSHPAQALGEIPSSGVAGGGHLLTRRCPFFLSPGPRLLRPARGVFRPWTGWKCPAFSIGIPLDGPGKGLVSGKRTTRAAVYQSSPPYSSIKFHTLQSLPGVCGAVGPSRDLVAAGLVPWFAPVGPLHPGLGHRDRSANNGLFHGVALRSGTAAGDGAFRSVGSGFSQGMCDHFR